MPGAVVVALPAGEVVAPGTVDAGALVVAGLVVDVVLVLLVDVVVVLGASMAGLMSSWEVLTAPIEDLVQRIGDDPNRVLLTDASTLKGDLETVFSQRKHLYEQMADYIVETHEKTDTEIINEIITLIQSL